MQPKLGKGICFNDLKSHCAEGTFLNKEFKSFAAGGSLLILFYGFGLLREENSDECRKRTHPYISTGVAHVTSAAAVSGGPRCT